MTDQPGLETDPYVGPAARKNALLPQGLKPSPHMANPDYPALGFNPVPGSTETVGDLRKKLADCAAVLAETHDLVTKLLNGGYWKGDAAVAFREQLDGGPLPLNLKNAARSIAKGAKQLELWEGELDDFQRRAKRLNEDARTARAAVDAAEGAAGKAGDAPALHKKSAGHEEAQKALTRANGRADEARAELERILGKARTLADEHEEKAQYRAGKIRAATGKLAPHEPGAFETIGDWISENLPDILSFTAGVIGLIALFVVTGGVAAAVLLLTAAALSAGAVTMRVSDPKVAASLKDGFSKGEFDSDFWGNIVSVGGDILGGLPGVVAVGLGIKEAGAALRMGSETLPLGQKLTALGSHTMTEARAVADLENPALQLVLRGARDPERAGKVWEISSSSLGVATAGYGLVATAVEAVDSDEGKNISTGIDGARTILDGGSLLELARHVFP